jgi:chromosome segregation protein
VTALAAELDSVVNTAHGTEIARAEHRLRLEQLQTHATEEYGIQPDVLVTEYGPDILVPMIPGSGSGSGPGSNGDKSDISVKSGSGAPPTLAEALRAVTEAARADLNGAASDGSAEGTADGKAVGVPYVREEQERRAEAAERQLAKLGKVNPLALEEYAALQERHQFLATQLEDLRKTRRDLLTVVKEVDDRVQEVFASAFADTAREFEQLFSRLFPGGAGRLLLTEPDDMLATGIEIEARPPGKKVKRLSLLSGGERSLTAIAYLFAIFKARPSPFYVLDEVEAALDDSNLQRLLRVFEELRENSQLIVITHQRRTMEAADALYGVSMRGDGVSTVISQRVREHEPA